MVNASVDFLDSLLPRKVDTPADRDRLYLDHLLAPVLDDVECALQPRKHMSLVLTVDQARRMMKHLCNVLVVEHIDLLVFREGIVKHIHDDASIVHHAQGVECRGDASLIPPVKDGLDAADSLLENPN